MAPGACRAVHGLHERPAGTPDAEAAGTRRRAAGAPGTAAGGLRACRPGRWSRGRRQRRARQHGGRQLRSRDRHVCGRRDRGAPAGLCDVSAAPAGRRGGDDPGCGGRRGEHGRVRRRRAGLRRAAGGARCRRRAADGGAARRDRLAGRRGADAGPPPGAGERCGGGAPSGSRSRRPRCRGLGGCRRPGWRCGPGARLLRGRVPSRRAVRCSGRGAASRARSYP